MLSQNAFLNLLFLFSFHMMENKIIPVPLNFIKSRNFVYLLFKLSIFFKCLNCDTCSYYANFYEYPSFFNINYRYS